MHITFEELLQYSVSGENGREPDYHKKDLDKGVSGVRKNCVLNNWLLGEGNLNIDNITTKFAWQLY